MIYLLLILLILAVLLEGTVTTLPLVFICLLCIGIMKREIIVFIAGFFAGLFLDVFTLQTLGGSSIFFICVLFLVFLYQRKYEINSLPFFISASFFGSLGYLFLFHNNHVFFDTVAATVIGAVLFSIVRLFPSGVQNTHPAPVTPAKAGVHFRQKK